MQVLEQSQLGERITSSWNSRCSTISGNDRVAKTEIKALEMRSQGTRASAALTSSNKMKELWRKSSESVTRVLSWKRQGWSSQMAAITTGRNRITGSSKRTSTSLPYLQHWGEKSGFYKQVRLTSNLVCVGVWPWSLDPIASTSSSAGITRMFHHLWQSSLS